VKPAEANRRIAKACEDALVEAKARRWKAAEALLREATNIAASMTSTRVNLTKVTPLKGGAPRFSTSTERCLTILALFTPERPVWGIAEMAEATGGARGTTHRYAATLVELGQLEQVAGRKYRRVREMRSSWSPLPRTEASL
jgi:IclR helix-turn-helix domain